MATREPDSTVSATSRGLLDFGVSPGPPWAWSPAGRALALLRGRDYVLPADVADVAGDVLRPPPGPAVSTPSPTA